MRLVRGITIAWMTVAVVILLAGVTGLLDQTWILVGVFGLWAGLMKVIAVAIWKPLTQADQLAPAAPLTPGERTRRE